jgi:DedD protein
MVMDQEPPSYPNDIQVTIPPRDGAPVRPPEAERPRAIVPGAGESGDPVAAQQPSPSPPPAPPARPAQAQPAPDASASHTPSAATVRQQNEARAQAEREAEAARVRRLLAGGEPGGAESYVVQVGAFADAAKAAAVVSALKQQGFSAYTEKAGNMIRVRVGPVASRPAGEQIVVRLKAQGYDSAVMAPR